MNFLVQTCSIGSAVIVRVTYDSALVGDLPEADLGFYKGGCPINLKRAPEVENRRRQGGGGLGSAPSPENLCISYIKM